MSDLPMDDFVFLSKEDVETHDDAILRPQSPQTLGKIREWLQPTAYDDGTSEYLRHLVSHVQGTGNWLPDTEEYRKWHSADDDHNVLWIKAVPGAGKSVLAAYQRARLSSTETAPVLHFFFRQIITANRTPKQLVRDWLAQMLPHSLKLQRRFKKVVLDQGQMLDNVAFQDLWDMLVDTLYELPRVYCFADALDEMSIGYEDFLVKLAELGQIKNCRVFLTSRPVPRIVEVLRKQPVLQVTLGPENMDEDISIYVDHRLNRDIDRYIQHRLQTSGIDLGTESTRAAVEPLVRSKLQSKAQGSFLYARLMMDNVLQAISKVGGDINPVWMEQVLDKLPAGLSEMYADMLRDHASRSGTSLKLQQIILQWVTHSERPLRMLELAAIIDRESGTLKRNKDTKAVVRTGCGPLIEILPSDVVGPVHHSFTEYLTNKKPDEPERQFPCFESKPTHRIIAKQCIEYILHVFQDATEQPLSVLRLKFPFLDYSLACWPAHVSKCGDLDEEMIALLDRLVVNNKDAKRIWLADDVKAQDLGYGYGSKSENEKSKTTPMHIAASVGIGAFIYHLQALGYDIDARDRQRYTPAHHAAEKGNAECLEILLRAGANAGANDFAGLTPLHKAIEKCQSEAAAVLLRHGVDPLTPKGRELPKNYGYATESDANAIKYAAKAGNAKTMSVLLEYLSPESMSDAMYFAIEQYRIEVAAAVLANPCFKVDAKCRGMTPIFMAAANRDMKLIKMLLDAGASCSILSQFNFRYGGKDKSADAGRNNPLHAFTKGRERRYQKGAKALSIEECDVLVKLFVASGCSLEARDAWGHTALQNAQSSYVMTSALLANGADPKSVILQKGGSPLHEIAGRDRDAMKLWMSYGLDINGRNANGFTPLHLVMSPEQSYFSSMWAGTETGNSGEKALTRIKTILDLGADPNMKTRSGASPLHQVRYFDSKAVKLVSELLLGVGADVHARDQQGMTPLMKCRIEDIQSTAQLYLDAGADVNAVDHSGETWLMKMIRSGNYGIEKMFDSDIGFDFTATNGQGSNLIHLFVVNNSTIQPLEKLLSLGVDPNAADARGNTALHYSVTNYTFGPGEYGQGVTKWLLDQGVEPRKYNNMGQSIFLQAVAGGTRAMDGLRDVCSHEFDVNEADTRGFAPLHLASAMSTELTVRLLREGADLSRQTHCGRTALHSAALASQPKTLSALLSWSSSKKADIMNVQDKDGLTALHYAARSGCSENVRLLLEAGADPNIDDGNKNSPLEACAYYLVDTERNEVRLKDYESSEYDLLGLLTKDWEEIVHRLVFERSDAPRGLLNIRQCIRYLVSAGAELYKHSQEFDGFQMEEIPEGQRIESAMDEALREKCEPMIYELMDAMEALDEKTGDSRSARRSCELSLDLKMYESRRTHLGFLVDSTEDDTERKDLMDKLLSDDSSEYILAMYRKGYDFFDSDSGKSGCSVLNWLAEKGRHATLRLLRPLLENESSSELSASHENWIKACVLFGFDEQHDDDLKDVEEALPRRLDGLLLRACGRTFVGKNTASTIVSDYGCSHHEMMSALFIMADIGDSLQIETIEFLLDQGIDVNFQNPYGATPLLVACHCEGRDKAEVVKVLLERGADPNITDVKGRSCLSGAAGNQEAITALLAHGATLQNGSHELIVKSICERDVETLRLFIDRGTDLNKLGPEPEGLQDDCDISSYDEKMNELYASYPLHVAFCSGDFIPHYQQEPGAEQKKFKLIVDLLLDGGADPFRETRKGVPIVHEVLSNSSGAIYLLDVPGLDLEKRDDRGRTLLLAGASAMHREEYFLTIKRLIELGCDVTVTDVKNRNFLHHVLTLEHRPFADFGLRKGIEAPEKHCEDLLGNELIGKLINAKDGAGFTPTHLALASQSWDFIKVLLRYGADIGTPDPNGENAFHHLFKKIERVFSEKLDQDIIGANREVSAEAILENEERVIMQAVEDCQSAGNNVNALSSGPTGEPPIFSYLRCCQIESSYRYSMYLDDPLNYERFVSGLKTLVGKAGVDLGVRARNGQGALHVLAARTGRESYYDTPIEGEKKVLREAWQMLVDAGLDPYMEDDEQRSALDIAAASGNTAIMEMY